MGDKRQEIERLGQTSVEVRYALDAVRYGYLDYESALEVMVICLVEGNSHLKDTLMEYYNTHPAPVMVPIESIDPEFLREWGVSRLIDKEDEERKNAEARRMLDILPTADVDGELTFHIRGIRGHAPGCECEACTQLAERL